MKTIFGMAIVFMAMATNAVAGTQDGPYAGAGIGGYTESMKLTFTNAQWKFGSNQHDFGIGIFGGYKWTFGKSSVAAELSYNSSAGNLSDSVGTGTTLMTGKLANNFSVSALPGYNLAPDTTTYLRLGYTQASGTVGGAYTSPGFTHTFQGIVWGFGIDQDFAMNLSARLEYQVLEFSSWTYVNPPSADTTWKPRSSGFNIAIRYAF